MSRVSRFSLALIFMSAFLLPLQAQEQTAEPATPETPETPADTPPPVAKDEDPEPAEVVDPTEEQVSGDNNLTFPVDI
jgi:hypothetical protein